MMLDAALRLASQLGLERLSLGAVAEMCQVSKSGVFSHFGAREELQIAVIREYRRRFELDVFYPALDAPKGLARLERMFRLWMRQTSAELESGGCIFISGAVEFDDRMGPVRDVLVTSVSAWHESFSRTVQMAQETGELSSDVSAEQLVFEIHGLILTLHYDARFLKKPQAQTMAENGFARLLAHYGRHSIREILASGHNTGVTPG